jgi:hypothetical protein
MRKCLLATLVAAMLIPGLGYAQKAGSLILGFDLGLSSPMGDFANNDTLMPRGGFGIGAELRYTLLNDLSFGPFIRYNRFGSDRVDERGHESHSFTQLGGLAQINLLNVQNGKFYICGGAGIFTPKTHFWAVSNSIDITYKRGTFFNGGIGLSSDPKAAVIYGFEIKYNMGKANVSDLSNSPSYKYDFLSFSMKIGFNSKGTVAPSRY